MIYSQPNMHRSAPKEQQNHTDHHSQNRLDDMLDRYGECCTQTKAAHILGKSPRTISRMLDDGRLRRIDTSVDVRSIVQYLESPRKSNIIAKVPKKGSSNRHRWDSFAMPR